MANISKQVAGPALSPWGKAVAGALAAMVANILVYPLDIVKTRLQVQTDDVEEEEGEVEGKKKRVRYNGTFDALKKIYSSDGIPGLYSGLPGTLIGVASTNFAYFYWYGLIRDTYIKRITKARGGRAPALSTATELLLGALAGALAQLFTIPVSVITTKQQTADTHKSLKATALEVMEEDGVSGLWRGLKASLVLVVNPSITYGSFERLKKILFPLKSTLKPSENFLLGALSKALATVSTQPMIVAKVMQQSSDKNKRQYKSFVDALSYLFHHEGVKGLFKGLGPQISKGVLVQGLLFMFKDQVELFLVLFFRLIKQRLSLV